MTLRPCLLLLLPLVGCLGLTPPNKLDDSDVAVPTGGTGTGTGQGSATGTGTGASGTGTGTGTTTPGFELDCENGLDDDNDGAADCEDLDCPPCVLPTCDDILQATPGSTSGIYAIEPEPGVVESVWCDMATDGGGWTLVASSLQTFDDAAIGWHDDLITLDPNGIHNGVWDGLRERFVLQDNGYSDIRFACVQVSGGAFRVDLSFYDVRWYTEITTGTDADSCFNENNGLGQDPPPARRNNLTGDQLPAGNPWNSGYFEGEDACDDTSDFVVDFDDGGMTGDAYDGTDWGENNGAAICGPGGGFGWFVFVR